MTQLLKDLFDLPAQVHKSDFVLQLTSGVENPEKTAETYVVTPGLKDSFDRSLQVIGDALRQGANKATYLHGSFGSGKSHFMAVLSLLIDGNEAVWKIPQLHPLRDKHDFVGKKKLLQLRYHMIGARAFEEKVLGEYVDFVRTHHPDAPMPGVFADEELFENARQMMAEIGEEKFFTKMGGEKAGWGTLATGWDRARFDEHATSAEPKMRAELFAALVDGWFSSYVDSGRYVDIDTGLSVMASHAKSLGYDGIVLYLDELILWLSHRASQREWLHNEVQKMVKLVESQESSRAIPIVSFIARQRNLAEMVGKMHTGTENQLLHDSLTHWDGRFGQINLEDRDLPAIVEKRVLKTKSPEASATLKAAFEQLHKTAGKSFETLQGKDDLEAFRKLYPFSPALVSALVALSNSLQRERTAIKLLMELLVEHIPDLEAPEVVRVGDLFDVLSGGEEPADGVMRNRFTAAKELYKHQFLPVIQETNGTNTPERCQRERDDHPMRLGCSGCAEKLCRADNRIVKTLLIAALVPEVDELKNLTVSRLYRLNHGTVKSMIPGQESTVVTGKIRKWSASIAQIQIGSESDPSVKVRLEGVDLKPILQRYEAQDGHGARQRILRETLFEALSIDATEDSKKEVKLSWKGTNRKGTIHFGNVRTMNAATLACPQDHDFRLVIDYPFDEAGHSPQEDLEVVTQFRDNQGSWTLAWLPHFFSDSVNRLLGELTILDYILSGREVQRQAVQHLTIENQQRAINDLENLRAQKRNRLVEVIEQAYGLKTVNPSDIDSGAMVDGHLHVLKPGASHVRPDLAANLATAKGAYIEALLELRYPRHPNFQKPLSQKRVNSLVAKFTEMLAAEGGRLPVDRETKSELAGTLGALDLVRFSETHVLKHEDTRLQPLENKRVQKGSDHPTVGEMRGWLDESNKMGLPVEAEDLLLRCYAVWASRSFELDGRPLDPEAQKVLPDRAILEKPELPTQQEWNDAFAKAGQCFGLTFAGRHLSPDNLGRLQAHLDARLQEFGSRANEVATALGGRLTPLGLDATCDRMVTAKSAEEAVLAIRGKSGVGQVRALAYYEPKTSASAVGRQMQRLEELLRVLQDGLVFGAFEQVARRVDELVGGEELLEEVRSAVRQDELNVQLAPRLRELAHKAQALLTSDKPQASPKKILAIAKASAIGKDKARAELARVVQELESAINGAQGEVELRGSLTLEEK